MGVFSLNKRGDPVGLAPVDDFRFFCHKISNCAEKMTGIQETERVGGGFLSFTTKTNSDEIQETGREEPGGGGLSFHNVLY